MSTQSGSTQSGSTQSGSTRSGSTRARLDIDLTFSVSETSDSATGESDGPQQRLSGTIVAAGSEVELFVDHPDALVRGRSVKLADIRPVADEIAALGLSVTLSGPDGLIARIGDVNAPLVQRMVTGSPHIRIGSPGAFAPLLRKSGKSVSRSLAPPPTLLPLVPTISRRLRRHITTTHYTPGSGRPRLIFVVGSENWDGRMPREFDLLPTGTTIGSSAEADLRLEGLDPLHAEVRHDRDDEYILYPLGAMAGSVRREDSSGRSDGGQVLRTGARIELGPWKMAYFREEFADHGRPHGGRAGGELARQKPQRDPRPGHPSEDRPT